MTRSQRAFRFGESIGSLLCVSLYQGKEVTCESDYGKTRQALW